LRRNSPAARDFPTLVCGMAPAIAQGSTAPTVAVAPQREKLQCKSAQSAPRAIEVKFA
jgi:hypothetical protein